MITLADRITLARIGLAPLAAAAYLFLPMQGFLCLLVCGIICGIAEATDFYDGKVARARGEVSDFGKLADPFCDVFYRIFMFMILLLPAGGVGQIVLIPSDLSTWYFLIYPPIYSVASDTATSGVQQGTGLIPFLPVLIMALREIVAGALRSMAASKGLVLAARMSGKIKAWMQGATIITACGLPVFFGGPYAWQVWLMVAMTWLCAIMSTYSIIEYFIINKEVLRQLVERHERKADDVEIEQGD